MVQKGEKEVDIVAAAVETGIEAILTHHPRFRGAEEYIERHIDKKRLKKGIGKIHAYINERGQEWSDEEKATFVYEHLANYVASGGAFDNSAQKVILKKGLEEKTDSSWFDLGSRRVEGEKYIDKVIDSFRDVYDLMKSGDYAERMPELGEAVKNIYKMGFLDSTLDVLKSKGLLNERKYKLFKKSLKERTEEEHQKAEEKIGKYLAPKKAEKSRGKYELRKAAAVILGISGALLALSSSPVITGSVVGVSSENAATSLIGILFIAISLFLFLKR